MTTPKICPRENDDFCDDRCFECPHVDEKELEPGLLVHVGTRATEQLHDLLERAHKTMIDIATGNKLHHTVDLDGLHLGHWEVDGKLWDYSSKEWHPPAAAKWVLDSCPVCDFAKEWLKDYERLMDEQER